MPRTPVGSADDDRGFTLIELLVVILIIGIVVAIALPLFLSQREKGVDASVKSDLRSAALSMDTRSMESPPWAADSSPVVAVKSITLDFRPSPGNDVTVIGSTLTGYCLTGVGQGGSGTWYYDSRAGGLTSVPC